MSDRYPCSINPFEPVVWTWRERLCFAAMKRGTAAFNYEWRWWTKFTHQWEWCKVKGFADLPLWDRLKLRLVHRSCQPEIMWFVCRWLSDALKTDRIRGLCG